MGVKSLCRYYNQYAAADEQAQGFCKELIHLEENLAKGRYTVDGKSIIGICTMDLSKPLTLTIHEEDDTVMEEIREFVVKGR